MIRVQEAAEPETVFNEKVREPGAAFLKRNPSPKKWRPFWTEVIDEMHDAYDSLCAYTAFRLDGGAGTIDHYLPKSKYPQKAYEWSNYRLCMGKINSRKKEHEDVIDPFTLPEHAFFIEFSSGEIYVNPQASFKDADQFRLAESSIQRLKLNNSQLCKSRRDFFIKYKQGEVTTRCFAPFVYDEMVRQGELNGTAGPALQ